MQRIMIIGQPGSGKSTLARALGEKTGLPVYHMDHIHWQAGWIERSPEEKTRACHAVEAQDRWIFEGGHSRTWANRAARAEAIIWLDLPLWLRFWRVLRRTAIWHGRTRPDLPEGCPEGFNKETLPFWAFIWRTRHRSRAAMARLTDTHQGRIVVIRLRSGAEARALVRDWPDQSL